MYAQQANTGIAPLDAVLATAQMVTPDGGNTVAAQVAQAAAQKLAPRMAPPPGIGALMPGVRQQAMNAAQAMQPVTQGQMQQMMQQNQGVAGLPAQNMRTFAAAQGGVVGYATGDLIPLPRRTGESDEEYALRMASMPQMPGETDTAYQRRIYSAPTRQKDVLQSQELQPTSQQLERNVRVQDKGDAYSQGIDAVIAASRKQPAPRPPAPPSAAAAPQEGIAQLAARPQYDTASIPAAGAPYMKAGEEEVARLRTAEGARAAFEKTLPDLSAKGIEALQQRMRDVEAADAARKESAGLDRVIQQLLGRTQGAGGAARADIQFMNAQNAAADAFSQARLGNQQAQLLLEKAQQERQLGRFDRAIALEKEASALMEKARDNRLKAEEIAQRSAGAQFQGAVQMRGQDITERTAAADRATHLQIARIQAAARNDPQSKEAMAVARVQQAVNGSRMLQELAKAAAMGLPGAQEKYDAEEAKLYQRLAPELLQGAGAAPALAPPPAGAVRVKGGG